MNEQANRWPTAQDQHCRAIMTHGFVRQLSTSMAHWGLFPPGIHSYDCLEPTRHPSTLFTQPHIEATYTVHLHTQNYFWSFWRFFIRVSQQQFRGRPRFPTEWVAKFRHTWTRLHPRTKKSQMFFINKLNHWKTNNYKIRCSVSCVNLCRQCKCAAR